VTAARLRLATAALAGLAGLLALIVGLSRPDAPAILLPPPVEVAIGWSFVGAGLVGWARRPDNRTGLLMTLTGLVWFGRQLEWLDTPLASHLSHLSLNLFVALIAHQLVVFPAGVSRNRTERSLVVAAYAIAIGGYVASRLFYDPTLEGCPDCPKNLLLLLANRELNAAAETGASLWAIAIIVVTLARLVGRWGGASPPARRILEPVAVAGPIVLAVAALTVGLEAVGVSPDVDRAIQWASLVYATIPVLFLAGLLRTKLRHAAIGGLLVELRDASSPAKIRSALANALGDPSLEIVFWLPDQGRYVDANGRPVEPAADGTRAMTELDEPGGRIAAIVHDPSLLDDAELVLAAAAAARMAIDNARLQAELRAQLVEVRESRARIVEAGDAERRRLERDLHDGAQQRLLGIRLALRVARGQMDKGERAVDELLAEAENELAQTLDELRALARGIHPAVLTEAGLGPAVETLARRGSVPVRIEALPSERLPVAVEAAAYFIASEALANVAKHAGATAVGIAMHRINDTLVVDISDDGVGGAEAAAGTGLIGLRDRVEALGGRIRVDSPSGGGTRLHAEIPCGAIPASTPD
jgi:signal transduction histidine kinase